MTGIEKLEPGLRRILAPNPSPMTKDGTNTYLLGKETVVVIDPGPDDPAHLAAILAATRDEVISHILVTHAHRDHSALARRLGDRTGAPVLAYGDAQAGRSAAMAALAGTGTLGGGEGVDSDFAPDLALEDGGEVRGNGWRITTLWTPGHFGNHMSFAWNDTIFTGDLVMGWASSLVSPPDGDLTDFMASCDRLAALSPRRLYPGHGAPVDAPGARIEWLIAHRRQRERQILDALGDGAATAEALARRIYDDLPAGLLPAATRNVLAHLISLRERGLAAADGALSPEAPFCRTGGA